jgi:hypothetical protein
MNKSLGVTNSDQARAAAPDIKIHGDPKAWECVAKASSAQQGWMKSTKRMKVPGGWIYQVTTEFRKVETSQGSSPGSYNYRPGEVLTCAEALTFVPDQPVSILSALESISLEEIKKLKADVEMWKQRAAKHGCDVEKGDPDCG